MRTTAVYAVSSINIKCWWWITVRRAGLTRDRRSFLSLQIEIGKAQTLEELGGNICRALEMMRFDRGELHLLEKKKTKRGEWFEGFFEKSPTEPYDGGERQGVSHAGLCGADGGLGLVRVWARGHHRRPEDVRNDSMLRIEIPLGVENVNLFKLVMLKNLTLEPVHPYTLRRVEHLRRSVDDRRGPALSRPRVRLCHIRCCRAGPREDTFPCLWEIGGQRPISLENCPSQRAASVRQDDFRRVQ